MIDFYYWPTPNGWKISIMLEECGLDYRVIPVNIMRGDQFDPDFLRISPNNRMPAIVDHAAAGGPLAVFESGAILVYLAEKAGQFLPPDGAERMDALQWLFWQVGGLGPMAGQLSHFRNYAPQPVPYALERYAQEYDRLLGVMDGQLKHRDYLAGEYSIADMAAWPWVRSHERLGQPLDQFDHVRRWLAAIAARPAVEAGCRLGADWWSQQDVDEDARRNLFGQTTARLRAGRRD